MNVLITELSEECMDRLLDKLEERIVRRMAPEKEYYTTKEFAAATSYSVTHIRALMNAGTIQRDGTVGTIRFHKSELQKFRKK
jgi:hypothetical protein